MKKKILFVDDEPHLLAGLECSLHRLRSEWSMSFALGSKAALEQLEQSNFDVVVTDVHMDGMDGQKLLAEVKERNPTAVRIILSGTADKDSVMRTVGIAHQFVTKPCEPGHLKTVVQRALVLRQLLSSERLLELVARIDALPSLPSLFMEIEEVLSRGSGSIEDVGRIVAKDVAMSAKVLQLSNSAFFGASRTFTSPIDATAYLGLDNLKALVLTTQVFARATSLKPETLERIWTHSMRTGTLAQAILRLEGLDDKTSAEAFLAGLLHESGLVLLATELPDELARAWSHAKRFAMPLVEAERRLIGASHGAVGAYLMGIWGLPDPVVEAIAFCTSPSALPHDRIAPVTAVHVARAFSVAKGDDADPSDVGLDMAYLERLGLGDRLPLWRQHCADVARAA